MSYPDRLYPKKDFKIIGTPSPNLTLCRWTPPGAKLIEDDKKLSQEAIIISELPGFSTNGIPSAEVEDSYIKFSTPELVKKHRSEWKEGEDACLVEDSEFECVKERGFFLFKVSSVTIEGVYPSPLPKEDKKVYEFNVYVIHKPIIANYFHFELEIYDVRNNKPMKNLSENKDWQKIIGSSIREALCENAKFSLKDFN